MFQTFLTDPKYSYFRHALITGAALFVVGVLEALTKTDFGSWNPIIAIVVAGGLGALKGFTTTPTV